MNTFQLKKKAMWRLFASELLRTEGGCCLRGSRLEMGMNRFVPDCCTSLSQHHRCCLFPLPTPPCWLLHSPASAHYSSPSSLSLCPVLVGASASLLPHLQLLLTQMRRWGSDSSSAAFEWVTARGGRQGKHTLLLGLDKHSLKNRGRTKRTG